MASTYTPISSTTLAAPSASVVFSAIPQTYSDLVLKMSIRVDSATTRTGGRIKFNSATTGYTETYIIEYGGTTVSAGAYTGNAYLINEYFNADSMTTNAYGSGEMYLENYSAARYKAIRFSSYAESLSGTTPGMFEKSMQFASTAAITSITLTPNDTVNFMAKSTFTLYGISNS